ncbi:hypothetical protein FF38_11363 [Lucilia cuprina]|uniref:Uncharacterized protein n=1 Tax=Lucilia cuprina TaxID=7375 RepID=A0A0L0C3A4_LUCCU|nr:hypothetical protein CVS40_1657 [Lucilia cuprina]KNC26746.1 hypothetical protein FF38_11363 [Lucilia cuprina]
MTTFCKILLVILLTTVTLTSTAPLDFDSNNSIVFYTNSPLIRHLFKRDLTSLAENVLQENPNEFADKDYDMELAEVNVFRPVFRYRASYARRGG